MCTVQIGVMRAGRGPIPRVVRVRNEIVLNLMSVDVEVETEERERFQDSAFRLLVGAGAGRGARGAPSAAVRGSRSAVPGGVPGARAEAVRRLGDRPTPATVRDMEC